MHPVQLALSSIFVAFARMSLGSSLLSMIALSMSALALAHQNHPIIGSLFGAIPPPTIPRGSGEGVYATSIQEEGDYNVCIVVYNAPLKYDRFSFVYNPNAFEFSKVTAQASRVSGTTKLTPELPVDLGPLVQGLLTGGPAREVVVDRNYPALQNKNHINHITLQFYLKKSAGPDSLSKFRKLLSCVEFRRYDGNVNVPKQVIVRKSGFSTPGSGYCT